jgi:hypothetical protein
MCIPHPPSSFYNRIREKKWILFAFSQHRIVSVYKKNYKNTKLAVPDDYRCTGVSLSDVPVIEQCSQLQSHTML